MLRLGVVSVIAKVDTRAVRMAQWIRCLRHEQEVLRLHRSQLCASITQSFYDETEGGDKGIPGSSQIGEQDPVANKARCKGF